MNVGTQEKLKLYHKKYKNITLIIYLYHIFNRDETHMCLWTLPLLEKWYKYMISIALIQEISYPYLLGMIKGKSLDGCKEIYSRA